MAISLYKRNIIYQRDKAECVYCGSEENLTIDHFIPISKGGKNISSNLQTLCFSCNNKKGDRMPDAKEIYKHQKRLADIKKNKPVDWNKLKLPPVGLSDGMVISAGKSFKKFREDIIANLPPPATGLPRLSRNHGSPPMPSWLDFDWKKYDESVRVRADQVRLQNLLN